MTDGWQPIGTAPEDEPVLVNIRGKWADGSDYTMQDVGKWMRQVRRWVFHTAPNYYQQLSENAVATHWMPLPEPPHSS